MVLIPSYDIMCNEMISYEWNRRQMSKNYFLSKTVWFNIISILIYALQKWSETQIIDPTSQAFLTMVGNLILRKITVTSTHFPGV